ncbi:MAG: protein kinase [Planctomycetota bacterium]
MSATNEDFLFAQEAQNLGYVTEAQVEEGFLLQRRMAEDLKIDERLAVILVKRGWLADEQARRVRARVEPRGAGAQIEGYQLLARLGRGAMGTVYKARHLRLNRLVAIKVLRRDLAADPTQVERLRSEAEMLASLDHPNIVRALDAGESNGFPYFVMEYVEGENLRDRIARDGPLDEERALEITRGLADALEKARRMGVVHRDVKPGNVLLTRQGVPKLMDLGLAKGPVDLGLTQHGSTVGTPQFISPEQAQDPRKADTRSDIYSLGATLYAMLAGRPPFEGSTLAEIITKVLYEQPTPLRVMNPAVSGEAGYLVERMMLKDPSLRYPTPADVVTDVDRILGGRSIVPVGFTGNWEAWLLRRRLRVGARRAMVALAVVVVLGVAAGLFVQHNERSRARDEADVRAERLLQTTKLRDDDAPPELPSTSAVGAHASLQSQWAERARLVQGSRSQAVQQEKELASWEEQAQSKSARRDAVDEHLRRLGSIDDDLDRLGKLVQALESPMAAGRLGEAWQVFLRNGGPDDSSVSRWVLRARSELERVLGRLGEKRLLEQQQGVAAELAGARSFEALATSAERHKAWLADDANVPPSLALERARQEADRVGQAIGRLRRSADELDGDGSQAHAREALDARTLPAYRSTIERKVDDLSGSVDRELEALAEHDGAILGPPEAMLDRLVSQLRTTIEERTHAALQQLLRERQERAQEWLDSGAPPDAEAWRELADNLEAVARDADRDQPDGGALARKLAGELRAGLGRHAELRDAAWAEAEADAFQAIQAGDAAALRDVVARRQRDRDPALGAEPRLEALLAAAAPLEALERQALERVDMRAAIEAPRLRPGAEVAQPLPDRILVRAVDRERGGLEIVDAKRSQSASRFLPVRAIHPEVLLAWARTSASGVPPDVEAYARLSALGPIQDAPGVDLRPSVAAHESADRAFDALGEDGGLWARFVRARRDLVVAAQRAREQRAAQAEADASTYLEEERYVEAQEELERLRDPSDRLRWTRTYDERRARVDELLMKTREGLERDGLRALVPGARVAADGKDVVEFRLDLDTPEVQKRNFLHGLGEFVREGGNEGVITPGVGTDPYALLLLAGAEAPIYDRPLSFAQMFDPALPFEIQLTLHTRAGAPLIAFDMDGPKLAVVSADPRAAGLRLPGDIPPLERETRSSPPEWNIYGLGRGVGFQTTPLTTFGSSWLEGWTWPEYAAAANEGRWTQLGREEMASPDRRLFAFEPGRSYRVRVVRQLDRLELYVDGRIVATHREPRWAELGTRSDRDRGMRHGTGRISLLTWTPVLVDDIVLRGVVQQGWRAEREAALAAEAER